MGKVFDKLVSGPLTGVLFIQILKELRALNTKVTRIMASQQELAARLNAMRDQNEKARAENARLLQELRDAVANSGNTSPEVDAALEALAASIQAEDDENPDAA